MIEKHIHTEYETKTSVGYLAIIMLCSFLFCLYLLVDTFHRIEILEKQVALLQKENFSKHGL